LYTQPEVTVTRFYIRSADRTYDLASVQAECEDALAQAKASGVFGRLISSIQPAPVVRR
jgi:hypothetical protein